MVYIHPHPLPICPFPQIALSKEISKFFASTMEFAGKQYHRVDPLVGEYISIPEHVKMERLIDAVIRTIVQCKEEKSEVQLFAIKYNNAERMQ